MALGLRSLEALAIIEKDTNGDVMLTWLVSYTFKSFWFGTFI